LLGKGPAAASHPRRSQHDSWRLPDAVRKALESEQGKAGLEENIERLEIEKSELTKEVRELKAKCEFIEKRENERRAHDEKKHADEVVFLKRQGQQLKSQLEAMMKKA
jgi:dynein light intermediate chain, axonemal